MSLYRYMLSMAHCGRVLGCDSWQILQMVGHLLPNPLGVSFKEVVKGMSLHLALQRHCAVAVRLVKTLYADRR